MMPAILLRKEVDEWLAKRGARVILRRNVDQSNGKRCILSLEKSVSMIIIIVVVYLCVRPCVYVCVRACVRTIIVPSSSISSLFGFSCWLEPPTAGAALGRDIAVAVVVTCLLLC
jgi:hypothetical protein